MFAGGLFDSDKMIQKAFEMSVKAVNRNITASQHAMGVLLTPKIKRIDSRAFQVANIST